MGLGWRTLLLSLILNWREAEERAGEEVERMCLRAGESVGKEVVTESEGRLLDDIDVCGGSGGRGGVLFLGSSSSTSASTCQEGADSSSCSGFTSLGSMMGGGRHGVVGCGEDWSEVEMTILDVCCWNSGERGVMEL